MAAEVAGSVAERDLLDALVSGARQPAGPDQPSTCRRRCRCSGQGEPVSQRGRDPGEVGRGARARRRQARGRAHPRGPACLLRGGDSPAELDHAGTLNWLRDAGDPRRAGAGPGHRRGRPADLPDLDLQAGRGRRHPGRLRVLAHRQPDPHRARGVPGRPRERQPRAFAFASGMAAEDCLIRALCSPGDRVIIPTDAYGGTYRLFAKVLARVGGRLRRRHADRRRRGPPTRCAERQTRLVWVETPTNPLLSIVDIARARRGRARGRARCSSSTTRSPRPYLQRPLDLGADVVVHSTTKYLGGHSDVVGGAVVLHDADVRRATSRLPAERHRRGRRPVRLLAHAARDQDARGADGPALRERRPGGRDAGRPSRP